jgi:hypothetical protein
LALVRYLPSAYPFHAIPALIFSLNLILLFMQEGNQLPEGNNEQNAVSQIAAITIVKKTNTID